MLINRQTDQPIVICPNKASKQSRKRDFSLCIQGEQSPDDIWNRCGTCAWSVFACICHRTDQPRKRMVAAQRGMYYHGTDHFQAQLSDTEPF